MTTSSDEERDVAGITETETHDHLIEKLAGTSTPEEPAATEKEMASADETAGLNTVSGSSLDIDAGLDADATRDPEVAAMEADIAEVAEDIRDLIDEMGQQRKDGRLMKEKNENRMAIAAARLVPIYIRISAMSVEERRSFLKKPATPAGVDDKKWPDPRSVNPDAVMLVHKYFFDDQKVRKKNHNVMCNRIGYTAAVLAKLGLTDFEEAHQYIMKNGKTGKISLQYTAEMKNKREIGQMILDAMPPKTVFRLDADDGFPTGLYRALLLRKTEGADYQLIDDLAPDEKSIGIIIENYYDKKPVPNDQKQHPHECLDAADVAAA